ncbi:MAG TPA: hypothetical protein VJC14_00265 [Candidatus Paceibacterota bacterium]
MEPNTQVEQKTSGTNGALIGSIIIILILIVGGIYLWKVSLKEEASPVGDTAENTGEDTASMEANVNSIELESLDEEI